MKNTNLESDLNGFQNATPRQPKTSKQNGRQWFFTLAGWYIKALPPL